MSLSELRPTGPLAAITQALRDGATPEILNPLNPDLVFSAATAAAIAERLREALRGQVKLPTSEECRTYVQRFGWPEVVPRILEVYGEAIELRRA